MTQAKRGRPRKVETEGALTVKVAGVVHDGKGGFFPLGHKIDAADPDSLKAKGFAE